MKKVLASLMVLTWAGVLLAGTKTATFFVQGWTCGSCAASTRAAVQKLDGVADVKTDMSRGLVIATYDDEKITPEEMIRAIEGLGYKAGETPVGSTACGRPDAQAAGAADGPAVAERVSFFEVSLECGASEGLGCGSASKPVLRKLERDSRVRQTKINHPGTVLAVVWKDPAQSRAGAAAVEAVFKERDLEATLLRGPARDRAAKDFQSGRWYGAADVDRLSQREARVIAARLVNRAKPGLGLSASRLEALTKDLAEEITVVLTRDNGEECARDPFEGLGRIASKHLNPEQMAVLRKAAEQGAGALPGEAR